MLTNSTGIVSLNIQIPSGTASGDAKIVVTIFFAVNNDRSFANTTQLTTVAIR